MPCARCRSDAKPFAPRRPRGFAAWSRAAAKYAQARLRDEDDAHPAWRERAGVCASCPLRVEHRGEGYCGRPMWLRPTLDPLSLPGCGCPIEAKAKDPGEHCPRGTGAAPCDCPWCAAA